MLVNARKIFRPGDHDGFILLAIEDVSEERAARAESKRNWQLTQSIVDTIRDPLVVLENDMTIVTASKAFLTMFGITEAETHGRRVSELGQHQWDVPALRHLMEKVLPENKPIESFEIEDNFPGLGRRVFNLNARKISQPGNHAHRMLLVFEDITDRKQRERDALSLTNEISHRIKNNLQIIVGLIAYEARWTAAPCVQGYKAMQARIGAIAQLYDLISQSSRGRTVAVDAYLAGNRQDHVGEPAWKHVGHQNRGQGRSRWKSTPIVPCPSAFWSMSLRRTPSSMLFLTGQDVSC